MKTQEIQKFLDRSPFRPFSVRVNSGAVYKFSEPRDVAATKSFETIFWFGEKDWVMMDSDSITEVIEHLGQKS